jgi:phage terminase small subunit
MAEKIELTEKQRRFIDYYVETANITDSARRAGYKQPHVQGSRLLENDRVKPEIEKRLKALDDKRIMRAEEALQLLTAIARNEEREEVVVFGEGGSEIVEKGLTAKDRLKALELIGKRYALFTEKQEITNVPVFVDDVGEGDE